VEQEQPPTHTDRVDALAAELISIRRAFYALVEALVWAGFATPLLAFILLAHLPGGLVWPKVFDALHALLSGAVALMVLRLSRRLFQPFFRGVLVHYAIAVLFAGVLGAGVEVAQMFTQNDPSLKDFARDILGALAALACAVSLDRTQTWSRRPWVRWALRLGAVAILCRVAYPAVQAELQLRERVARFPRLADFESESEVPFVYGDNGAKLTRVDPPSGFALAEGRAGNVTFARGEEYPKLEVSTVGDWSKARALVFDVYSDSPDTVTLAVRIDDKQDRRFNTDLTIPPGQSTQRILTQDLRSSAEKAELDLAHMKAILLFLRRPSEDMVLTFDSIRLEL
jgi:VanZ family protein